MVAPSRIALGTAQFGLSYGVANAMGTVAVPEIRAILDLARLRNVDTLDTAMVYGDSEERLGRIGVRGWHVVTKLPMMPAGAAPGTWVKASVRRSLEHLGIDVLDGLLLHRPEALLTVNGDDLHRALLDVRASGLVRKIGVSIYEPAQLEALPSSFRSDLVQAPFNVFDRRLVSSGWLARLADAGVEVHARSVFLQGLLLMDVTTRPKYFSQWQDIWRMWDSWVAECRVTRAAACLAVATACPTIARIVVGVDNRDQLRQILNALDAGGPVPPAELASSDPALVNPSRWPNQYR